MDEMFFSHKLPEQQEIKKQRHYTILYLFKTWQLLEAKNFWGLV